MRLEPMDDRRACAKDLHEIARLVTKGEFAQVFIVRCTNEGSGMATAATAHGDAAGLAAAIGALASLVNTTEPMSFWGRLKFSIGAFMNEAFGERPLNDNKPSLKIIEGGP